MDDLIKIMISSCCKDKIKIDGEEREYSYLKDKIKEEVEAVKLFNKPLLLIP